MKTLRTWLEEGRSRLASGLDLPADEARQEVLMLVARAMGDVSRAWLLAHDREVPESEQTVALEALLQRRLAGEPVAYILGEREFYGLTLRVSPDVLIPRPDTETLVEAALARIPETGLCRVLDLGTGSGAIALAIAAHRPAAQVTGIDRSPGALRVASGNAQRLGIANVEFIESDWFLALADRRFDVIVSNPPYIAEGDPHLAQGDLRFEPVSALGSGPDGLRDIRYLAAQAAMYLQPAGWLLLEHGYDQAESVAALLRQAGYDEVETERDLAGIGRVTLGKRQLV